MVRKIGTHTEVVVVKSPKKKATCVYLDETRICRCKKSARYTEKCFEATLCTYKTKGKYQPKRKSRKRSVVKGAQKKIMLNEEQCLLKAQLCEIGRVVHHFKFGKGKVISYSENQIVVLFDIGEKTFDLDTIIYNEYIDSAEQ